MTTLTTTEASSDLQGLIDQVRDTHQPIVITGKNGNAVLVAQEDWNAINETLYLLSVPGMRESIRDGMKTGLHKFSQKAGW